MDNLDKVQLQILNFDQYVQRGSYGVTSLENPRYKAWVEANNPNHKDCTPLVNRIDSKIGTGFHTYAEEAMKDADFKCATEKVFNGEIAGYNVGGTCDLILYDDNNVATVTDFKTMKAFPAKKALNGETDKFIKQLSVYAYLMRQGGAKVNPIGYIYGFVVGWTQRDKAIPRLFRLDLELMTDAEVEAYVADRIGKLDVPDGEAPEFDCPTWQCGGYCGVADVCPHNNNHGFGDER
jgi:hypothetical protein